MKAILLTSRFSFFSLHWEYLIENLDSQGYEIIFISKVDIDIQSYDKNFNHKIIDIDINRSSISPLTVIKDSYKIFKEIKMIQPDVFHSFYFKPSLLSLFATLFLRRKIRFFFHLTGLGYLGNSSNIKSKVLFFVSKCYFFLTLNLTRNSKIVVETAYLKNFISKSFKIPTKKISIVNGVGIDTKKFTPTKKIVNDNTIKFLMVSRLLQDKGVMEFHDAACLIKKDNLDTEFYIIGTHDIDNPLSITTLQFNIIKKGPVQLLGYKQSLEDCYKNFDVFVLPSYHEGLSVSSMEAGSSGLPLVLSNIPGCRELVNEGENGFLFKPRTSDSLYSAIKKVIISREKISIFGKKSRLIIESLYSKEIVISQLNALYKNKD